MVIVRHDAGQAVHSAFIGIDPVSSITPVETTIVALARLDAYIVSVIELLLEKESSGGRRQKDYFDSFGKLLCSVTTQLVKAVCQFVEYWQAG